VCFEFAHANGHTHKLCSCVQELCVIVLIYAAIWREPDSLHKDVNADLLMRHACTPTGDCRKSLGQPHKHTRMPQWLQLEFVCVQYTRGMAHVFTDKMPIKDWTRMSLRASQSRLGYQYYYGYIGMVFTWSSSSTCDPSGPPVSKGGEQSETSLKSRLCLWIVSVT
jgi:hypothetical protein